MTQLGWADIFLDASELDFGQLFGEWSGVVTGQLRPIGASVFGDCYFERPSGAVERLNVLDGEVEHVAASFEEFSRLMNSREWQEESLLTEGVALLIERGVRRAPGQFYGFAPHPALTGRIDWKRVMPLDAIVWHSICAQSLGKSA